MTQHPHPVPRPPHPPQHCDDIEQCRETVEVQARTIRYLLQNYELLLKKVEGDEPLELEWSEGAPVTIDDDTVIPAGLWVVGSSSINVNHTQHGNRSIDAFDLFYADGTTLKAGSSAITITPLQSKIVLRHA